MSNYGHHSATLLGLIDLYILRCRVEGKSPRTVQAHAETLHRFLRIAKEDGFPIGVSAIEPRHLIVYRGRYANRSLETRHRYFREVRCFFNWLVLAGYLRESPFRSLPNVRLAQRIVQPFSPEVIVRLLDCCGPDKPVGARDHAMLLTLLDTGVRCAELVQLTRDDLNLQGGRLQPTRAPSTSRPHV